MYNVHVGYTDTMDSLLRTDFGRLLHCTCMCISFAELHMQLLFKAGY